MNTTPQWRVGHKNSRNLYFGTGEGEHHLAVAFTEELGHYLAAALNSVQATDPPIPSGEAGRPARPACTCNQGGTGSQG